jgi:putative metallopeptidase
MPRRNGTAADDFANLPTELATRHRDLLDAMSHSKDPIGEFDSTQGSPYIKAYAPEAIAKILIGVYHGMLNHRPIAYLWRESMKRNGKITLGKASLAGGKIKHFGRVDFVIEFNWGAWQELTPRERIALVDHELTHCFTDGESLKPIMIPHDVEEFGSIVRKWGLWQPDLEEFGKAVTEAAQMSLFEPAGA